MASAADIMTQVWEAFYADSNNKDGLDRVVTVVLDHAIAAAKTEARRFRDVHDRDAAAGAEEVAGALITLKAALSQAA